VRKVARLLARPLSRPLTLKGLFYGYNDLQGGFDPRICGSGSAEEQGTLLWCCQGCMEAPQAPLEVLPNSIELYSFSNCQYYIRNRG